MYATCVTAPRRVGGAEFNIAQVGSGSEEGQRGFLPLDNGDYKGRFTRPKNGQVVYFFYLCTVIRDFKIYG